MAQVKTLQGALDLINSHVGEAVNTVGYFMLAKTINKVPIFSGDLRRSGKVHDATGKVFSKISNESGSIQITGKDGDSTKFVSFGGGLKYAKFQYGKPVARGNFAKRHPTKAGKLTPISNVVSVDPPTTYSKLYNVAISEKKLTPFKSGSQWFKDLLTNKFKRKAGDIFANKLKELIK